MTNYQCIHIPDGSVVVSGELFDHYAGWARLEEEYQKEMEQLQVRINGYADANVELRATLRKLGRHPEGDMEGVGRCAGFRKAAPFQDELCDCGLNAALGTAAEPWTSAEIAPEKDGFYWCYLSECPPQSYPQQAIRFTRAHRNVCAGADDPDRWWTSWRVSHWRELPEPPESEKAT